MIKKWTMAFVIIMALALSACGEGKQQDTSWTKDDQALKNWENRPTGPSEKSNKEWQERFDKSMAEARKQEEK